MNYSETQIKANDTKPLVIIRSLEILLPGKVCHDYILFVSIKEQLRVMESLLILFYKYRANLLNH